MRITHWIDGLAHCKQKKRSFVMATVIEHKGSVPRDSGSKMVVTTEDTFDTIGGGNLEFQVTHNAREMLLNRKPSVVTEEYPLSAKVAQCCGGFAKVLLELHHTTHANIAVFGAGHVANELIPILQRLPVSIMWIDERDNLFPEEKHHNVSTVHTDCPATEMKHLPLATLPLVMTHNHQRDFDLVRAAICRKDIHYVGMIGSETKAKRFRYKLAQRGCSNTEIAKLVSPVGELSVPGKTPIEVAISIAAQVVQQLNNSVTNNEPANQSLASDCI